MQYIYVLDYSTPSRVTIKVDDDVDISENIDDILRAKHLKESECAWMVSNKPLDDEVAVGIKIVGPATAVQNIKTAVQNINIYNDSMKKKELKIPVDFNVGDKFWVMINNKPKVKKVEGINIKVIGNNVHILYESGISVYNPSSIYHTKQELLDSL